MSGFCECLDCGEMFNRADLVAGLCPECTRRRIAYLAAFRQDYQEALDRGDIAASVRIAGLIKDYEQAEATRAKMLSDEQNKAEK